MFSDHTCPTQWAVDHGLAAGSPMNASWCLTHYEAFVRNLPDTVTEVDASRTELRLWAEGRLSAYFAPWDWVNLGAKVMLVGIAPGRHQATEALREARRCLLAGQSYEEALRSADAVGSFSGPMRTNLVTMLDGIGVSTALGLDTTDRLFDTDHHLAAHVSTIDFPVFVDGDKNYGGTSPSLAQHPTLRALVRACLGARTAMVPRALVIPLGKAATEGANILVKDHSLPEERCLLGFPHPSGNNAHRKEQYEKNRVELAAGVSAWFAKANELTP